MRRIGFALMVAALAVTAFAQQPSPAGLTNVEGNVLVSQGTAMVAAAPGQRVAVGQRVVTTAGARATVRYDTGCEVRLGENQAFTVRPAGDCGALIAAVETLGPAAGAIGGGAAATTFAGVGTAGWVAIGGITALAIYESTKNDTSKPKSPN